jgi:hypothetical protein
MDTTVISICGAIDINSISVFIYGRKKNIKSNSSAATLISQTLISCILVYFMEIFGPFVVPLMPFY